jgi:hypothetical protein
MERPVGKAARGISFRGGPEVDAVEFRSAGGAIPEGDKADCLRRLKKQLAGRRIAYRYSLANILPFQPYVGILYHLSMVYILIPFSSFPVFPCWLANISIN